MKSAKIIIALLLALCMVLAIAACTNADDKQDTPEETTTTTAKSNTLPDPPSDDTDDEPLPDPVAQNVDDDISGRPVIKVDPETAAVEGLNTWGDQVASCLFDDDTVGTKLGGDIASGDTFTLTFRTEAPSTAEYYVLYTGGDTSTYKDRNPISWIVYGSMTGESYTVIDNVEDSETSICGLEPDDSTPFTYKIDTPTEYLFYKIEFSVFGTQFQLNEIQLIGAAD